MAGSTFSFCDNRILLICCRWGIVDASVSSATYGCTNSFTSFSTSESRVGADFSLNLAPAANFAFSALRRWLCTSCFEVSWEISAVTLSRRVT